MISWGGPARRGFPSIQRSSTAWFRSGNNGETQKRQRTRGNTQAGSFVQANEGWHFTLLLLICLSFVFVFFFRFLLNLATQNASTERTESGMLKMYDRKLAVMKWEQMFQAFSSRWVPLWQHVIQMHSRPCTSTQAHKSTLNTFGVCNSYK